MAPAAARAERMPARLSGPPRVAAGVGRSFAMTTNRWSPSSSKPDGRTRGVASAERGRRSARPRAARRRRSAPSRRRASRRSRAAAARTPPGPAASRRPAPRPGRGTRGGLGRGRGPPRVRQRPRHCRSRGRRRSRGAASAFLLTESTSSQCRSGRARASTRPGTPPPDPRSTLRPPRSNPSSSGRADSASSRCRRATSAGSVTRVRLSRRLAASRSADVALGAHRRSRAAGRPDGSARRRSSSMRAARARSACRRASVWGKRNAPPSGLSVFPGMVGVAAGFRIGPEPSAVTVLGRSQKQDRQPYQREAVDHNPTYPPIRAELRRPVDNSPRYTRA